MNSTYNTLSPFYTTTQNSKKHIIFTIIIICLVMEVLLWKYSQADLYIIVAWKAELDEEYPAILESIYESLLFSMKLVFSHDILINCDNVA